MIAADRPVSPRAVLFPLLFLLAIPTPFLAVGCGLSAESTPGAVDASASAPKIEYTKKERAKMHEMDYKEMLAYKKKIREERGQLPKGE
ncbi:MAG: hypothetical protein P4L85_24305 [Paludisphaera borealis]|uniref:hypothetical protein n=1 Tax=Paludisphaera borealis TaxID=1387353 RepID=UPI00283B727F|nr:hypothetical protein [Paludisphaera borealis]MDR3622496.1 hypothetical protein [Paludisphaera borealis]